MKTFAFYKKVGKDKTEITVYRIMRNKPVFVGRTSYLDFKREVKRMLGEYTLAGDGIYISSRCDSDWRKKELK